MNNISEACLDCERREKERRELERREQDRERVTWTEADVAALAKALASQEHSACRFTDIAPEDLKEAVAFYKNFNKFADESKVTIWRTILVLGIGGLCTLLVLGFWTKMNTPLK
jgi:predicted nucleic acid-binding protein